MGHQFNSTGGRAAGRARFRNASLVLVGCGWKLMPSSAKNIRNDSRIPLSTLVAAKVRSAATNESSAGEDFRWLKPIENKTVSVIRTDSTFFNAILPERGYLVGGVDAANDT